MQGGSSATILYYGYTQDGCTVLTMTIQDGYLETTDELSKQGVASEWPALCAACTLPCAPCLHPTAPTAPTAGRMSPPAHPACAPCLCTLPLSTLCIVHTVHPLHAIPSLRLRVQPSLHLLPDLAAPPYCALVLTA